MKIGLISFHSFYKPGGVKRHVLGLHKEFKKRGIYSKIIVPRRESSENYGKDVILLGTSFPVTVDGTQADFDINFNPLAIDQVLSKEKFDILHFHNFIPPSALQILISHFASNTLNILTIHANVEQNKFLRKSGFWHLCKKIIQWKIDGIIGVAPLTLRDSEDFKGPKIVIPNGIDLEEFNPKVPKLKKFLDSKINILFVGRIEERKGLIYLLKAFKILAKKFSNTELQSMEATRRDKSLLNPSLRLGQVKKRTKSSSPLRLIIVGEGKLKKDCQNYVKENNLKEVYFEGAKMGQELVSYYNSCDIFCSPAIFGESFGLILLEAMACQKPVVAFANQGYKQFLKGLRPAHHPPAFGGPLKGERFLAKPKDFKELAQKLEILIKNPKLREEMGEWGITQAKKYSWPKIADQILGFYKICQKQKEKRRPKPLFLKAILNKVDAVLQKDILDWLR